MEAPLITGDRVKLRPLTEDDVRALVKIVAGPGVREWWPSSEDPERTAAELRSEPNFATFAIEVDGELAGWLGVTEESDPYYRHAGLDIVLAPPFQGRRLGPEALRTAIRWLIAERGHHRFTIDPALANQRAVRAYAAVGFRPVGVLRQHERGPDGRWRDGLLMELLAAELDEPVSRKR